MARGAPPSSLLLHSRGQGSRPGAVSRLLMCVWPLTVAVLLCRTAQAAHTPHAADASVPPATAGRTHQGMSLLRQSPLCPVHSHVICSAQHGQGTQLSARIPERRASPHFGAAVSDRTSVSKTPARCRPHQASCVFAEGDACQHCPVQLALVVQPQHTSPGMEGGRGGLAGSGCGSRECA